MVLLGARERQENVTVRYEWYTPDNESTLAKKHSVQEPATGALPVDAIETLIVDGETPLLT